MLLVPQPLALDLLLVQERLDADSPRLGAEVAAEGVRAREAASAAPLPALLELALADELLLARVQPLVALAVVLPREGFAADGADEGALVGVSAEMGAEVVGAREALGAERALEGGGVFLDAFRVADVGAARDRLVFRVREAEDVVAVVRDGGGGLSAAVAGGGGARSI